MQNVFLVFFLNISIKVCNVNIWSIVEYPFQKAVCSSLIIAFSSINVFKQLFSIVVNNLEQQQSKVMGW